MPYANILIALVLDFLGFSPSHKLRTSPSSIRLVEGPSRCIGWCPGVLAVLAAAAFASICIFASGNFPRRNQRQSSQKFNYKLAHCGVRVRTSGRTWRTSAGLGHALNTSKSVPPRKAHYYLCKWIILECYPGMLLAFVTCTLRGITCYCIRSWKFTICLLFKTRNLFFAETCEKTSE